jgi:hypothetical protein
MKKILTLIVASMLALSSQSFSKDLGQVGPGNLQVDFELQYLTTNNTTNGFDLNSARPGAQVDLDFTYRVGNFGIIQENFFSENDDDTSGDDSFSTLGAHALELRYYFPGDNYIGVGGSVEQRDFGGYNNNVAGDNASSQFVTAGFTVNDILIEAEYSEDLTDGDLSSGNIRHSESSYNIEVSKDFPVSNIPFVNNINGLIGYYDQDNRAEYKYLILDFAVTDNFGFMLKGYDNEGKGTAAASDYFNRDFAIAAIRFTY